jgi:hypothetical protein
MESIWNYVQTYTLKEVYHNYDIQVLMACVEVAVGKEQVLENSAQIISVAAKAIYLFRKQESAYLSGNKVNGSRNGKKNKEEQFIKYK